MFIIILRIRKKMFRVLTFMDLSFQFQRFKGVDVMQHKYLYVNQDY